MSRLSLTALPHLRSVSRNRIIPSIACRYQSTSTIPNPNPTLPALKENELAKIIRDTIKSTGPIPISRYMQFCLSHPTHGYYQKGDVFGEKGDFVTSPEISQIFGELVAIWFLTRWMEADSPTRVRIVELGPGRGTLMDDVLRTLFNFPGISASIRSIHLVENSEALRTIQGDKLSKRLEGKEVELGWYTGINEIPETTDTYTLFIAHEFFDAMPINTFEKTDMGWREAQVDNDPAYIPNLSTQSSKSGLCLSLSSAPTPLSTVLPATSPRFSKLSTGSRIEVAQDSFKIMRRVGEIIGKGLGGSGVVVDYGGDRSYGQSFRAFKNHKIVDVFDDPGNADLTANVDFAYLRESLAGTGSSSLGPISQSSFLLSLGLQPRLRKLLDSATDEGRKEDIRKAAQRLIDPLGMGGQYQVMGVTDDRALKGAEGGEIYPFIAPKKQESKVLRP
ncbi:hypothetical protein I302_102430 [Kwoniella bestiolae CBS 10118]|uniref:Protein arginine methyltransferase NDUFAF7 n=1 Tax=Kwoniella bestiolae CBS 10118 TaxID=1296100 RepID=A0A1B9GEV1_9TREE|nr:hypothetical protein I302_01121 [Kwoniella bestiolae CBS 10118]OCF29612.1 hypothetical protein I302_01121 [Kwoniella bestiolae CBS 10118]